MPDVAEPGTAQTADGAQLPQSTQPGRGDVQAGRLVLRQRDAGLHRRDVARAEAAVVAHAVDVEAIVGGVPLSLQVAVVTVGDEVRDGTHVGSHDRELVASRGASRSPEAPEARDAVADAVDARADGGTRWVPDGRPVGSGGAGDSLRGPPPGSHVVSLRVPNARCPSTSPGEGASTGKGDRPPLSHRRREQPTDRIQRAAEPAGDARQVDEPRHGVVAARACRSTRAA